MRGPWAGATIVATLLLGHAQAEPAPSASGGHYLFAWAGDPAGKAEDFITVIDADPASPGYGQLITTAASGIRSQQVHHTEYWMSPSGLLFANDHTAGQTALMDLRDPLHPHVATTFGDLAGFSHPHSFLRLPNGHVLASFQVEGHGMMHHAGGAPMAMSATGLNVHGGLVEIDDAGHAVRSASTADPARPRDLLMAYSLLPLPDIDRVLVTNSSMRPEDPNAGTYQIFRLSDLKRLSTNDLDHPAGRYGEINPEEARRGPDGSVYVLTLGCGVERITGIAKDHPRAKLVYQFAGSNCGVPSIASHYLIETVPLLRAVVVIDLAKPNHPVEVSRLNLGPDLSPHWTGYDPKTRRLAVTGYDENRLYMLTFDPATGALGLDKAFHDAAGRPGFDFNDRAWPHGWTGSAQAHGVVFTR